MRNNPAFLKNTPGLTAIKFDIPVQKIAPGLGRIPETDRYMQHGRNPLRLAWAADQGHACFFRGTAAFAVIAGNTAGDNIFPSFSASHDYRDDMVECEIFSAALLPAILACVVIPRVNIGSGELHALELFPDFHIFKKS